MDTSTILTIVGLIATFVFGFLSIDLFKRKRYPGKITFVKQQSIGLFDSFVKNFNEISISFNNNPIKDNLIYFKGCFINDGDLDIEGERIEKPISIHLPDKYSWKNCQLTEKSNDLKCEFEKVAERQIEIRFGLFRKGEFIQIEALVEASHDVINDDNIFDKLSFSHRISQTQKIQTVNLLTESQIKKRKGRIKERIWTMGLQMFLAPIIITVLLPLFFKSAELQYKSVRQNGDTVFYKAVPKEGGKIELTDVNTDDEKTIDLAEFQNKESYIPTIPHKSLWDRIVANWMIIPAWAILVLLFGLLDYWEVRKSNKIYRIIQNKS